MSSPSHLEIVALGGLGEFGMNLMVYRWGDDCVVVDAGMMFPGAEHLGIDVVIPDLSFLDDCGTVHGVVLTHGHEDHIGAVPYLLARHDLPVYCTAYTEGLVRHRLSEHGLEREARLLPLPAEGEALALGPFGVQSLPVTHSIPQSRMLVLRTPVGLLVHTADFKIDPQARGAQDTDLRTLAALGREGVLALLSDSTNADRPGLSGSELQVAEGIDALLARAEGRVLITTFASHIQRVQNFADLARKHRRKLALVGASMQTHTEVAERLGLLRIAPGARIAPDQVMDLAPREVLVLASGTQGEPMSSMARIAVGKHRDVGIEEGDWVIHSAREIPGNAISIGRMVNHLLRRGATVFTSADAPVHVSGHAARDELRQVLELLRPRFLIPIHGEYRQLLAHARMATAAGMARERVLLADSGDLIALDGEECSIADRVPVGQVFIDATLDEVDSEILRDRRRFAGDGIVVPVVTVDRRSGVIRDAEIITRGFVPGPDSGDDGLLSEAQRIVRECLSDATPEERTDEGLLKARIQSHLRRWLRRRTQRKPLIIPVIVEF